MSMGDAAHETQLIQLCDQQRTEIAGLLAQLRRAPVASLETAAVERKARTLLATWQQKVEEGEALGLPGLDAQRNLLFQMQRALSAVSTQLRRRRLATTAGAQPSAAPVSGEERLALERELLIEPQSITTHDVRPSKPAYGEAATTRSAASDQTALGTTELSAVASQITRRIHRTTLLANQELERSKAISDSITESSANIRRMDQKYDEYQGQMALGNRRIEQLRRAERRRRRYVALAFLALLASVCFIVLRRLGTAKTLGLLSVAMRFALWTMLKVTNFLIGAAGRLWRLIQKLMQKQIPPIDADTRFVADDHVHSRFHRSTPDTHWDPQTRHPHRQMQIQQQKHPFENSGPEENPTWPLDGIQDSTEQSLHSGSQDVELGTSNESPEAAQEKSVEAGSSDAPPEGIASPETTPSVDREAYEASRACSSVVVNTTEYAQNSTRVAVTHEAMPPHDPAHVKKEFTLLQSYTTQKDDSNGRNPATSMESTATLRVGPRASAKTTTLSVLQRKDPGSEQETQHSSDVTQAIETPAVPLPVENTVMMTHPSYRMGKSATSVKHQISPESLEGDEMVRMTPSNESLLGQHPSFTSEVQLNTIASDQDTELRTSSSIASQYMDEDKDGLGIQTSERVYLSNDTQKNFTDTHSGGIQDPNHPTKQALDTGE